MTACMFSDEFNPGVKSSDQAIYGLLVKPQTGIEDDLSCSTRTKKCLQVYNDTEESEDEQ